MKFPDRIFTAEEVRKARRILKKGYKHRLTVKGSREFKTKAKEALKLVKTAGYYDLLRKCFKQIVEVDGFSQLREAEAAVWANKYLVNDPIEAASFIIQKAQQMKDYLERKTYYGGEAEARAVQKRIEFLEALKKKSRKRDVKKRCEEILRSWSESAFL